MISRHFVDVLIREKHWEPYIKSHWLDIRQDKAGVTLTFKGHEQHEYKCSYAVATEIISSFKVLCGITRED